MEDKTVDKTFVPPTEEETQKGRENEYAYLQRQYRIASTDSARYGKESMAMIHRQEALIEQMQRIKREVMVDTSVAQNPANSVRDNTIMTKLTGLLVDGDELDEKIRKRRIELKEIDTEIQKTECVKKKLMLSNTSDRLKWEESLKQRRRESRLDNQLQVETKRMGAALADNMELRDKIEHCVVERSIFNKQYNQLLGKLAAGKKVMGDLLELAGVMYDQRQEAGGRLSTMLQQGNRHKALQTEEMCKLVMQVDMDKELKEFVAVKGQRRVLVTMQSMCEERRERMRRKNKELVGQYRQILKDITTFTEETDVDRIVNIVQERDNFNFNVYIYALALHELVEVVRREITALEASLAAEKSAESERKAQRRNQLARLRLGLRNRKLEAAAAEATVESQRHMLDRALKRVTEMFEKVQADKTSLLRYLGDNESATEYNYLRFLGRIEPRLIELLVQANYVEANNLRFQLPFQQKIVKPVPRKFKAVLPDALVPTNPCSICAETDELSKLEEQATQTAMTKSEAKMRLLTDLRKPEFEDRMHNLSACRLPRSRKILQRRYM